MKICELCTFPARTYCESDEACLCWDCDTKVHAANFLVARHSRTLLCQTCQSLTPWKAVGAKLGRTVSVCDRCVNGGKVGEGESEENEVSAEEDDLPADEEVGDTDNQVVPWSSTTPTPPPADASSSSSSSTSSQERPSGVVFESVNVKSLKRTRESSSDLRSRLQIDLNRSYPQQMYDSSSLKTQADGGGEEAVSVDYLQLRGLKERRTETERQFQAGSRSKGITTDESLKRFHQRSNRKVKEESEAVGVDSSGNPSRTI